MIVDVLPLHLNRYKGLSGQLNFTTALEPETGLAAIYLHGPRYQFLEKIEVGASNPPGMIVIACHVFSGPTKRLCRMELPRRPDIVVIQASPASQSSSLP